MNAIETDDLSVTLGRLPILRSISVTVANGEAVALMGTNGSGKTTLVRALLGLIGFQRGSIRLFGTELAQFSQWSRIGYVPQRAEIQYPQARVSEVVTTGLLATRRLFRPRTRTQLAQISAALEQVGMADRAAHPYHRLSSGQQQRVLIARALVSQAELLIMDEPLAGVDLGSQTRLAEILAALKNQGSAMLIVLHETGPLESMLDRQIVLRDGRVLPPYAAPTTSHGHETQPRPRTPLLPGMLDRGR
ncbi:MAG: ATP-binding cassette domain-containing protein [Propionibacteriaceae bacterium]|nr:ATP-binding cassette domain-containing protein [Propionibacteriaceae bacterium]